MRESKRSSNSQRGRRKPFRRPTDDQRREPYREGEERYVGLPEDVEEGEEQWEDRPESITEEFTRRPTPTSTIRVDPYSPVSEYTLISYYDKALGQYVVSVAEFPDLKLQGTDRNVLLEELEQKLEDQFEIMRRRGESLPESISGRQYPERLEVPISSGLYRRLDWLSRMQRTSLEKLVTEMLSAGIERRFMDTSRSSGSGGGDRRPVQHSQRHGGNQRPHGGGGRQGGQRHGGGGGRRNFHENLDNRENFLEYVRNLEKGKFRK